MRGLGVVGVIVLAVGLYMAFARMSRFYPGLVFVVGCLCCAVFLLINDSNWSRPER